MTRLQTLAAAALAAAFASHAARAASVTETVTTSASPAKVWSVIGPFPAIADWLPGAVSSPADKGDAKGSVRVITLKAPGDPTVTEKLLAHKGHSYTYAITSVDPKVLPVTAYTSTISVKPAKAGSVVTWHGDFQPAGGADEASADKAISGVYRAGLDNIKTLVEK
jgi:hypothetical protein